MGGFESMNRKFNTYNIYYPIVFENTLNWDTNYFSERPILKALIRKKSKYLYKLTDQNYDLLNGRELNLYDKIRRRFSLRFRTWGLNYEDWMQDPTFVKNANKIFRRENALFFSLLGMKYTDFIKMNLFDLHAHVSLDLLKLKKILDIIYYKEFDFIELDELKIKGGK